MMAPAPIVPPLRVNVPSANFDERGGRNSDAAQHIGVTDGHNLTACRSLQCAAEIVDAAELNQRPAAGGEDQSLGRGVRNGDGQNSNDCAGA